MSTDSYSFSATTDSAIPANVRSSGSEQSSNVPPPHALNQDLVKATRDQIRALVDEISALAETRCDPAEFYQGFLTRATSALASIGGAVWRTSEKGPLQLAYHVNFAQTGIADDTEAQQSHARLLHGIIESGAPTLVPPGSGTGDENGASNPTKNLLIVGPLVVDQQVVGLVEIFQRPDAGPTTQRGYLRFVVQMCKTASEFLKNNQLRLYSEHEQMWQRMDSYVRSVHRSLNINDTLFAIANEGRRVIDCDRVSVAVRKGRRMQIQTTSGLDTVERRADQIKKLSKLATTVVRAGETMWYDGDDADLPPQIENQLHQYLDVAHSKLIIVQPLRETMPGQAAEQQLTAEQPQQGEVIGALVVEQLGDNQLSPVLRQRLQSVQHHASDALTNATRHNAMFLAPLWTWLGNTAAVTQARRLPKTAIAAIVVLALFAMLWLIPYPFTLSAGGKLTPEKQSEIFAQVNGVLQQILVPEDPDELIQPNQPLAVMTNNDLMVDIQNLQGQLQQAEEKIKKLQRAQHAQMTQVEHRMIEGDLAEAIESRESLYRQLQLKQQQAEMLIVRAPVAGRVVNWQLRQNLMRRPVQRGQNLMTIVQPETRWQLELEFPERRVWHLATAMRESEQPLKATFTLASFPGREFQGSLLSIDNKMDVRSDQGNSVLLRIEFDESQVPTELLRSGTRVTAQLSAGSRSLGYVWFHELFETLHSTWLLWF